MLHEGGRVEVQEHPAVIFDVQSGCWCEHQTGTDCGRSKIDFSNIVEASKENLCYIALACDIQLQSTSLPSLLFFSLLELLRLSSFPSLHFPHS